VEQRPSLTHHEVAPLPLGLKANNVPTARNREAKCGTRTRNYARQWNVLHKDELHDEVPILECQIKEVTMDWAHGRMRKTNECMIFVPYPYFEYNVGKMQAEDDCLLGCCAHVSW
jgi:hypothetical protein